MQLRRSTSSGTAIFGWAQVLSQIRQHASSDVRNEVAYGTLLDGPSEDSVTLASRLVGDQINYPDNYIS